MLWSAYLKSCCRLRYCLLLSYTFRRQCSDPQLLSLPPLIILALNPHPLTQAPKPLDPKTLAAPLQLSCHRHMVLPASSSHEMCHKAVKGSSLPKPGAKLGASEAKTRYSNPFPPLPKHKRGDARSSLPPSFVCYKALLLFPGHQILH